MEERKNEKNEVVALTVQEQEIQRWFERMRRYPIPLPDPVRYMAARMAVAYGLDPFLGEMMFIPQYKDGNLIGYNPYVGIGGVRRAARRTEEYGGRELRPCTEEEREALQVAKEAHAWFCQVWRKGIEKPFDGFGVFPMHDKDKSKAPPWRMARKRAEHDALRAAFDLELQLMEANGLAVEEEPIEAEISEIPEEEVKDIEAFKYEEAQKVIQKAHAAIEEELEEMQGGEDLEALLAYGEKKGLAEVYVRQVLEDKGGAIDEALAYLKNKYGEANNG